MALGIQYYGKPAKKPAILTTVEGGEFDATGGGSGLITTPKPATAASASSGQNAQTAADRLAWDIWNAQQKAAADAKKLSDQAAVDAAALGASKAGATSAYDYIKSLMGQGVPSAITGNIDEQSRAGKEYIDTTAANLLTRLTGARDTGQGIQDTGFANYLSYLQNNAPTAYAGAQNASPAVAQNTLAAYMQARGLDQSAANRELGNVDAAAVGGASNYNQLLNVLRGAEASGQESRLSEQQMAKTLADAQLQSIYGAGRAGVEQQQLGSLAELASRIQNARLTAQSDASGRDQSLQDALAKLLGTGYIPPAPAPVTGGDVTGGDTGGDTVVPLPGPVPNTAGYSLKNGVLVANLGKAAPGYDKPTVAELAKKPATGTAPAGTHWEWNGNKWVAVLNRK